MARPAVVVQQTQASALLWLPVYVRLPAHSKGSRVNMLIDTGAAFSALPPRDWEEIVPPEQWQTLPEDASLMGIAGSRAYARQEAPIYVLDQDTGAWRQCQINSILLGRRVSGEPASSVPSLLGMDVMRRCVLTYDGPSGQAELTVPAF